MMIVLSIIIILTIAAVPGFISLYQERHLVSEAQNLYYALQYARSEAIKNNQTVYVFFQTGDSWCYGMNPNTTCNCNTTNSCTLGTDAVSKTQGLSLTTTGLTNNNTLTFEGTHGLTNITSTVTFTIYGKTPSATLKISPLGNMQICSATLSGYPTCS